MYSVSIYILKDIKYEIIKELTFNITYYLETLTIMIKLNTNNFFLNIMPL